MSPRPTAIDHIAIIEGLTDDSVKLVFSEHGEDGLKGEARLTWFLGGHAASLSQLLPMLQSMGVVVLEERPFTVTRPDGLPVWIYQFRISPHPTIPTASTEAERDATAQNDSPMRSPRSGRAGSRSTGSTNW